MFGLSKTAGNSLSQRFNTARKRRFHHWLQRRIPASTSVTFNHGNIFILPNIQGLAFCLVLGLMFIGAINYEASLAFALVFLLLGMFLLTILYTFRNLSGLRLSSTYSDPVFAGTDASIKTVLEKTSNRIHESITLGFKGGESSVTDLIDTVSVPVSLRLRATKRGILRPGRVTIESVFPFGLCRAWSFIDLSIEVLVYPKPTPCDIDWVMNTINDQGNISLVAGNDDFQSLREYQSGDSLRHVAWKNFARGQGMFTKEYSSNVDERLFLNWNIFPGMNEEERLSRLCYCVLELDSRNIEYGLLIPGTTLDPSKGTQHLHSALQALALFGSNQGRETSPNVTEPHCDTKNRSGFGVRE